MSPSTVRDTSSANQRWTPGLRGQHPQGVEQREQGGRVGAQDMDLVHVIAPGDGQLSSGSRPRPYFGNISWIWARNCQSAPLSGATTL